MRAQGCLRYGNSDSTIGLCIANCVCIIGSSTGRIACPCVGIGLSVTRGCIGRENGISAIAERLLADDVHHRLHILRHRDMTFCLATTLEGDGHVVGAGCGNGVGGFHREHIAVLGIAPLVASDCRFGLCYKQRSAAALAEVGTVDGHLFARVHSDLNRLGGVFTGEGFAMLNLHRHAGGVSVWFRIGLGGRHTRGRPFGPCLFIRPFVVGRGGSTLSKYGSNRRLVAIASILGTQRDVRQCPHRRRGGGSRARTAGVGLGDDADFILAHCLERLGVRGYPGSATVPRVGGDIGAAVCGQSDGRAVASGSIINSDRGHGVHRDGQGSGFALAVVAVDVRHIEGGGLAHREGGARQGLGSCCIGVPCQRAAISRGGRQGDLLSTAQRDGLSGRCGRHLIQRHLRRGGGDTAVGVLHRDGLGNLSVNALQCKSGLCSSSITLEIILAGIVNPGVGGHIGGDVCRGEGHATTRTNSQRLRGERHRRLGVDRDVDGVGHAAVGGGESIFSVGNHRRGIDGWRAPCDCDGLSSTR